MTGDPSDVCCAPVDVGILDIEDPGGGKSGANARSGMGMNYSSGFASGAGGVEDEERICGVHGQRVECCRLAGHKIVPPDIPSLLHGGLLAVPLYHYHLLDVLKAGDGLICLGLGGDGLPPAIRAIAGDQDLWLAILQAVADGYGGES